MSTTRTLWEIEGRLAAALDDIAAAQDEGRDAELMLPEAAEYALEAAEKRDRCAYFLRQAKASEAAVLDEITRLQDVLRRKIKARERFEAMILSVMQTHGHAKLEGVTSRFTVVQNPEHVAVDPDVDPKAYSGHPGYGEFVRAKVTHSWDKALIRDALRKGDVLPFAWMSDGGQRLKIS